MLFHASEFFPTFSPFSGLDNSAFQNKKPFLYKHERSPLGWAEFVWGHKTNANSDRLWERQLFLSRLCLLVHVTIFVWLVSFMYACKHSDPPPPPWQESRAIKPSLFLSHNIALHAVPIYRASTYLQGFYGIGNVRTNNDGCVASTRRGVRHRRAKLCSRVDSLCVCLTPPRPGIEPRVFGFELRRCNQSLVGEGMLLFSRTIQTRLYPNVSLTFPHLSVRQFKIIGWAMLN